MEFRLTSQQEEAQEKFRSVVSEEISPHADQYDREECMPSEVVGKLAELGGMGAIIPKEYGGREMDPITFGLLCEEVGRGSGSLLSILTVHGMICQAILKWGSPDQKACWLPKLANGEALGAFGLTEPGIGSDAKNVETTAEASDDTYLLNGEKKWISFGQMANLFLIMAQHEGKPSAFLVQRETPGFSTEPISGLLGFRSAMLAKVHLNECRIPKENLVGRAGFGFSHVAGAALDHGRYCVAWGSVGMARACLEACLRYTSERKQFGACLKEHQLIQQMIAEMITNFHAAKMLCLNAGYLKEIGEPRVIMETSMAKYFASRIAFRAASDAVQIHGANGCGDEYPVQRYLRDAKITEIIEGSTQIQEMIISRFGYHSFRY